MPAKYLFDISRIDFTAVAFDQEAIRVINPHRGDMEMLNGISYADEACARLIGYKDVREDEFWVSGHIPGRPLFPGVLMIEAGAQLASFYTRRFLHWSGFLGFAGLEECRFRAEVRPPCRLYVLGERVWERHSRICCNIQGLVDNKVVFEAKIIGAKM